MPRGLEGQRAGEADVAAYALPLRTINTDQLWEDFRHELTRAEQAGSDQAAMLRHLVEALTVLGELVERAG